MAFVKQSMIVKTTTAQDFAGALACVGAFTTPAGQTTTKIKTSLPG